LPALQFGLIKQNVCGILGLLSGGFGMSLAALLPLLILMMTILPANARQLVNPDGVLSRINYGVIFRERQPLRIVTDEWTHVFITELPEEHNRITTLPVKLQQFNCTQLRGWSATSCESFKPLIDTLSTLHQDFVTRVRLIVHHIYTILPTSYKNRQQRGLLDIGGRILNSLFGVATEAQLQAIQNTALKTMADNANAFHEWQQHADEMSSFMSLANRRFDNFAQVMHNHETLIQHVERATSELTTDFNILRALVTSAISNITSFMTVFHDLDDMRIAIEDLTHGQLSPTLLPPRFLLQAFAQLDRYLLENHRHVSINVLLSDYYRMHRFVAARQGSKLLIALNFPLSSSPRDFTLYEIQSFPVPIPGRHKRKMTKNEK